MSIDDLFKGHTEDFDPACARKDFGIESDPDPALRGDAEAEIVPKKKRTPRKKKADNVEALFGKSSVEAMGAVPNSDAAPIQTSVQPIDGAGEAGISEACKAALAVIDGALAKLREKRNALWWDDPNEECDSAERLLWAAIVYLAGQKPGGKSR
jgi:hypothetical protein